MPTLASLTRKTAATIAGAIAALALAEAALRPLETRVSAVLPTIANDSAESPALTVRQFEEGVATAHFSIHGARLTGNPWIPSAPTAVLIGDSYVVAREVDDSATMGAQLERLARRNGRPLDVRQYGWRGASPGRYAAEAPAILARWNPSVVIVPLSNDDLDDRAVGGEPPYLAVDSAGAPAVVGAASRSATPDIVEARGTIVGKLVTRRWADVRSRAPRWWRRLAVAARKPEPTLVEQAGAPRVAATLSAPVIDDVPRTVVRALAKAYGDRLILIHLADVRVTGGEQPEPAESRLFTECAAMRVTCLSTRDAMLAVRTHDTIVRGFQSTTLGVGHLNPAGHRLVAELLWPAVRDRLGGAR